MDEREFALAMRRAMLMAIDAIERRFGVEPRTAELRRLYQLTSK